MSNHDLQRLLHFADALADAARAEIMPFFRAAPAVDNKGGARFDPVTAADRNAEQAIRARIAATFPDHGVEGEEFGLTEGRSGYRWIIDPIDGTRAFIAGLPLWGVLIGLYYEDKPLIGVLDQPFLDERYRGWNTGAEVSSHGVTRPLKTRGCAALSESIVSTTDPYLFSGPESDAFARVRTAAKLTRFGYDCYAYAMLAAGHLDCVVESGLKRFDIAAIIPIIAGAGGGVCAWDGGGASAGGRVLAYGDARVRDEAISHLSAAAS